MWSSEGTDSGMSRRVAVTGLGVVSPLGCGIEQFWDRLAQPSAACGALRRPRPFDLWSQACPADFRGEVEEFGDLSPPVRRQLAKSLKVMNRETQLGVAAGYQALRASSVLGAYPPERIGVTFGAENVCLVPEDFQAGVLSCRDAEGHVDLSKWGSHGLSQVAPLWLLRCLPNMPACHLAILADLRGPNNTITQRELGTDLALAEACRVIRSGDADAMLVGGSGTTIAEMNRLHAYWSCEEDSDESGACSIDGWKGVPAEGAGAMLLEDMAFALRRGACIYGEVLAAVSTTGRGSRIGTGGRQPMPVSWRTMRLALERAQLTPEGIGHLHLAEFGMLPWMDEMDFPANSARVVSARGRIGQAGAGSSAMELVASLLAMARGELFDSGGSAAADRSPARTVARRGEPAGESFLKLSQYGRRQASCVAVAKFRSESIN